MARRGKIILVLVIILVIIIGLLIYFVSRDLAIERQLKAEIKNYHNDLVDNKEVDPDNIVTSGDYAKVEKALKEYLSACNTHFNDLNDILNDEQINNNVTIQNIQTDGPNFATTKQFFVDIADNLNNSYDTFLNDFDDKTVMSYLDDDSISDYYKKFYYNLATNEDIMISKEDYFDDTIEKINKILNKQEEMINFLIANQTNWQVINSELIFYDDNLATIYSNYNEELNQITSD